MNGKILSERLRQKVWNKTGGYCWYCNKKLNRSGLNGADDFVVEHFIAFKRGGTDNIRNLVPACGSCNASKKDKSPREFFEWMKANDMSYSKKFTASLGGIRIKERKGTEYFSSLVKKRWEKQRSKITNQ